MDHLNLMCWNWREISGVNTWNMIKFLIHKHKLQLICFMESRANISRIRRFCYRFSVRWNWAAKEADGFLGGIICIWHIEIGLVTPIIKSKFVLHLVISQITRTTWILTIVYNGHHLAIQKLLWVELFGMSQINLPWLVIGDFNAISSFVEHKGGAFHYHANKARLFSNFMADNSLLDIGFIGSIFS